MRSPVPPPMRTPVPPRSPLQHYRSIKVPGWVYANWKQAELALHRRGEAAPPTEVLAPSICPACRSEMQTLDMTYHYRNCNRCGYTQQDLSGTSNFLGGMVLGIGLTLLLKALSEDDRAPQPRPRRTRR